MTDRYLIVGLGNPGPTYAATRHNIGFMVVDEIARRHAMTFGKTEKKAQVADGRIGERRVLLAKPQTYMNESGLAVRALFDFYKFERTDLIVICDDLDIPLGTLRLRNGGGHGGQNGVRSIINHLGSPDFARVRCGISRPPGNMNPADYVLKPFMGDDQITARIVIERAADAVETWLRDGIELAMTRHNGSVEEK
ncbi:MAG: aminoacyl-tRNA hydrolase [Anaerolineae bacterium]|jgi:PTH1 family peptidyl-tRNA hydrolase|nr:aminoacyl-tRNA hydrolase [Anaerolineae bacterium]